MKRVSAGGLRGILPDVVYAFGLLTARSCHARPSIALICRGKELIIDGQKKGTSTFNTLNPILKVE